MFIILVYDIQVKRVAKVHKICRKYLLPVQKSVFEGDITQKQLTMLKAELERAINVELDSICIYEFDSGLYSYKLQIGAVQKYETIL